MRTKLSLTREEVENNVFCQYDALIGGWLHAQPSEDLDQYWLQVEQAKWLEERFFQMMQACLWGKGE